LANIQAAESEHFSDLFTALASTMRTDSLPMKPIFISLGDRKSRQKIVPIACLRPANQTV
jgi:hypothetical protein